MNRLKWYDWVPIIGIFTGATRRALNFGFFYIMVHMSRNSFTNNNMLCNHIK